LLTSFDGANLFRPWQYKEKWRTEGQWWHVDQNAKRKENRGLQCVQGLVSLMDSDETVGGLCVIPKSHLIHNELCQRIQWNDRDFLPIPPNDKVFKDFANAGVLVQCKAGDLCLWDSRTIHCNTPSVLPNNSQHITSKEKNNWDVIRMVTYICMTPRYKASNEVLKQRQNAFETHTSTTHWPHYFIGRPGTGYVPHSSQLYDGKPFLQLNKEQLSLIGKPRSFIEEISWLLFYYYKNLDFALIWSFLLSMFALLCGYLFRNKATTQKPKKY